MLWRGSSDPKGFWWTSCTVERNSRSRFPPSCVTSVPSTRMLPAVGTRNPAIALPVVVLPEPDSPTRAWVVPRGISKERSSTATKGVRPPRPANSWRSPCTVTSGVSSVEERRGARSTTRRSEGASASRVRV